MFLLLYILVLFYFLILDCVKIHPAEGCLDNKHTYINIPYLMIYWPFYQYYEITKNFDLSKRFKMVLSETAL